MVMVMKPDLEHFFLGFLGWVAVPLVYGLVEPVGRGRGSELAVEGAEPVSSVLEGAGPVSLVLLGGELLSSSVLSGTEPASSVLLGGEGEP